MQHNEWLDKYFEKVAHSSEEGRGAVEFVRANRIRVGMKRARKSVGAFWQFGHRFYLNSRHYTMESALENPRAAISAIAASCNARPRPRRCIGGST